MKTKTGLQNSSKATHYSLTLLLVVVFLLLLSTLSLGTTRYVPSQYAEIQWAILASSNGDTVMVAPGTYEEEIGIYQLNVVIISSDGPEVTIIEAQNAGMPTVYFWSLPGAELNGFTVRGGTYTGILANYCGPRILNNIIENNSSTGMNNGGGIDLNNTSGCLIKGNVIRDNSAAVYGAAIHTENSTNDTICYNLFYDNYGYTEIRCLNTTAAIYNNTIDGYGSRWSGISNQLSGTLDCRNNIIVNTVANGIYADGSASALCEYNDNYNCTQGAYGGAGIIQGLGNFSLSPGFWGMPPGEPEEYDLLPPPFSPCPDAGDPNPFFNDFDGSRNDLGWRPWNYDMEMPDTLYVPAEYASIQAAINASSDGDIVLVAPGTYTENIDFLGKRIQVTSSGGADVTTIQANNGSMAVVYMDSGEPKGAEISGFTITGGGYSGIFCNNSSPTIRDNIIEDNYSPLSDDGGGLDLNNTSSSLIRDNIFRDNSTYLYGAAIHADICENDTICYNLFYDNYGYVEIRCLRAKIAIYNNTIDAAGSRCHGISNQLSDTLDCRNNIIVNAPYNYKGLYAANSAYILAEYNDVYNCGGGPYGGSGIIWGTGNITSNPLFWATPIGEPEYYDIRPFSPCVDAGDPDEFFNDSDESRNDMGWKPWYLGFAPTDIDDETELPSEFRLSRNYPNPFNASTTIEYSLPEISNVTIDIYDILGRHITSLVNEPKQAGTHQVTWHAGDIPSGMYFYRIQAGDYGESKKMLLLK
ncbi:MAG: T9SS type A sorting domain-containing protein [candidate division Zixibacteria bacterium]|nr:T9SS type A sorting domain-containing protein [candidate division Zixibacteria bacterium]